MLRRCIQACRQLQNSVFALAVEGDHAVAVAGEQVLPLVVARCARTRVDGLHDGGDLFLG